MGGSPDALPPTPKIKSQAEIDAEAEAAAKVIAGEVKARSPGREGALVRRDIPSKERTGAQTSLIGEAKKQAAAAASAAAAKKVTDRAAQYRADTVAYNQWRKDDYQNNDYDGTEDLSRGTWQKRRDRNRK